MEDIKMTEQEKMEELVDEMCIRDRISIRLPDILLYIFTKCPMRSLVKIIGFFV